MVVLKTEGLTKEYRSGFWLTRVRVLHDLDLEVCEGEIFGYLGPNGAGKTTTLKLLMGLEFADIGYVLVSGEIAMAGKGDDLLQDPEVGRLFLGG